MVGHYYIVLPGDTLGCLARQFGSTIEVLAQANQIPNPNFIIPGYELLTVRDIPNPVELKRAWEATGGVPCSQMSSLQIHGTYYSGIFMWQSLGAAAIPYLLDLLNNPCDIVRFYTIISLARIALNGRVKAGLSSKLNDPGSYVANIARLALRRIDLVERQGKRIHLTFESNKLYSSSSLSAPSTNLPQGTEIVILRWNIPSPTAEEGPVGGLQAYDWVQVLSTGRVGFLPRVGYNEERLV